jgi:DivIVA domain-containing protein
MASDITPEEIRQAQFRTVRKGLDRDDVSRFLDRLASEVEELLEERQRITSQLGDLADRDLETEFESLGREVAAVLQAAREAAESMRERATLDAARWRSEAMAEVDAMRKDAKNDAEALRGDAWATGSELLGQAGAEARRVREEAERDVLTVMGEAERDAHRLTSTARRDAEDVVRAATMDAEKLASEAKKRHDEIIDQAHRQAEAAQERTRALEERREELMEELETVRSALGRLEGTLEERRENLELSAGSTSVKVVPSPVSVPEEKTWELGETVRVIPPGGQRPPASPPVAEPAKVSPSRRAREDRDERPADLPRQPKIASARPTEEKSEPETEPENETENVEEPKGESPEAAEPAPVSSPDDLGALFASLRGVPESVRVVPPSAAGTRVEMPAKGDEGRVPASQAPDLSAPPDAIEERDARLLPITNRALRGVKKAVTDAQNLALDSLRTESDWHPDGPSLADMMRADLIGLWAESYSAGHAAAEEMAGAKLRRGDTPPSEAGDSFGEDLAAAVSKALIEAGDGQRQRQGATSRVFRGWRTDEAERRVRELALTGYHIGLVESVAETGDLQWVPSGTPCSACRAAANDPTEHLPPVHVGCECTLVLG